MPKQRTPEQLQAAGLRQLEADAKYRKKLKDSGLKAYLRHIPQNLFEKMDNFLNELKKSENK